MGKGRGTTELGEPGDEDGGSSSTEGSLVAGDRLNMASMLKTRSGQFS
jgi:hypothetical protein